jgi:hypothetical protein
MKKENVEDFPAIEFLSYHLQFTQYLISPILDRLKRKWKWYIISNIRHNASI